MEIEWTETSLAAMADRDRDVPDFGFESVYCAGLGLHLLPSRWVGRAKHRRVAMRGVR